MAFDASQFMSPTDSEYKITNSLRFENGDSAYLSQTLGTATNNDKATFSCWIKRGNLSGNDKLITRYTDANNRFYIAFQAQDKLYVYSKISGTTEIALYSTQVFGDITAWYHVLVAMDTTQGTASNRIKIYVNGTRITDFATETYPDQNQDLVLQSATNTALTIGSYDPSSTAQFYDGYMAEINFIDGAQKAPADFGETGDYGEWKPIKYAGTYGDNGYYLDFKSSGVGTAGSSTIGADRSGNTNHWTSTNIVVTDQMLDTPTNNFCTMNPLDNISSAYSEGNTKVAQSSYDYNSRGTIRLNSGKWYWEAFMAQAAGCFGVCESPKMPQLDPLANYPAYFITDDGDSDDASVRAANNATGASITNKSPSGRFGNNKIVMIAYDADDGKLYYGVEGTWQLSADPANGSNPLISSISTRYGGAIVPFIGTTSSSATSKVVNFGQDSSFAGNKTAQGNADGNGVGDFFYAPPSGFLALCSKNLPEPTVVPSENFNTVLYDGTGAGQTITGVGFQPDWNWTKPRNNAGSHVLTDSVRGVAKYFESNSTGVEQTSSTGITSFNNDGYVIGAGNDWSADADIFVAWNWKAGNATLASNAFTQGSIASTCSRDVDAGFSIVKYTGTGSNSTVGHGLSSAPEMILAKSDHADYAWAVYHASLASNSHTLTLNSTAISYDESNKFTGTAPTSSVFSVGNHGTNVNTKQQIAYCFHSVDGYSAVSSYIGNGNANGTFVYTGFKPAFILIKCLDATHEWVMLDNTRQTGTVKYEIYANKANAEGSDDSGVRFTSTGFKLTSDNSYVNANAKTFIYLAFANTPFKYSNAR